MFVTFHLLLEKKTSRILESVQPLYVSRKVWKCLNRFEINYHCVVETEAGEILIC